MSDFPLHPHPPVFLILGVWLAHSVAAQEIIVTQTPHTVANVQKSGLLDVCYPAGTRLVIVAKPFASDQVRVLSEGLAAAGSPVLSCDGRRLVFAGKAAEGDWQIFESRVQGGKPQRVTSMPGGAMEPALLPDGAVVFASPVPVPGNTASSAPQLYVQVRDGKPRQLTFAPRGATDPTVLPDGRILFVSAQPSRASRPAEQEGTSLYTINNDGTEITAFACQHDAHSIVHRPRLLNDARVGFLVSGSPSDFSTMSAQYVRTARPFSTRATLFTNERAHIRSIQPYGASNLLVCAETPASAPSARCSWACFRTEAGAESLNAPLFIDPAWDSIEAVEVAALARPMGRLSSMDPSKRSGQLLCLDVNDTTVHQSDGATPKAAKIRILTQARSDSPQVLGEVAVQADGSFMAEVPCDVPLGFEALDEQGQVIRREAPNIWVRSGENRSCVGCHAAHNRAPHNHRPQAVRVPVPSFCTPADQKLAGKSS